MKSNGFFTLAGTTAVLAMSHMAHAQLDPGDIILRVDGGGRIATSTPDSLGVLREERVFVGAFDSASYFTNEPGMDSEDAVFPAFSQIGFRIRAALREWDGRTFAATASERISVRSGPLGPVVTPLTDIPIAGFSLAVNSTGMFHHHPGYLLLSGTAIPEPGDGVYLYEIELFSNDPAIRTSRPFWIVFHLNRTPPEHAAAAEWVYRRKVCPPDFNLDRQVDFFDYLDFVAAFAAGETAADINDDAVVDLFDYLDFVGAFSVGCVD